MVITSEETILEDKHEGKYYDPSKKDKYLDRGLKMNEKEKLTKKCRECETIKFKEANFNKSRTSKDGYMNICKDCREKNREEQEQSEDRNQDNDDNSEAQESIYEWVKNLPKDKKILLDMNAVGEKIKQELFGMDNGD